MAEYENTLVESEWYDRVTMTESDNTLAESEWYGCWITLAESE